MKLKFHIKKSLPKPYGVVNAGQTITVSNTDNGKARLWIANGYCSKVDTQIETKNDKTGLQAKRSANGENKESTNKSNKRTGKRTGNKSGDKK